MAKAKVKLYQRRDGNVNRVNIDGKDVEVAHAAITLMSGKVAVSMTLQDVDVSSDIDDKEKAPQAQE